MPSEPSTAPHPDAGPLEGIRILDLSQGVAAPYATKLFADYGAEVTKIERPGRGDVSRRLGPFPGDQPHHERSGMFLELNTGKRSVTLNLKTRSGRAILLRLAEQADLAVESFRPGTLERLGIGDAELREVNPGLSLVRVSNFGQDGPYRDFEADDLLAYAMGGVLSVTAMEGREPVKIGLYAPFFLAGGVIAAFAFGAFNGARRTGRGERADVSLMEVLAGSMDRGGTNLVSAQYTGALGHPIASAVTQPLPAGAYPCKDGYFHINASIRWWDRFCRLLGRPELIDDPDYVDNLDNPTFHAKIDELFIPWALTRTKREVMIEAQAHGLGATAIYTMEDLSNDPHVRGRGFFREVDHPSAGRLEYFGPPFALHGTPVELRPAPLLGQHTLEVLTERLGYTREQVVRLRQRDAV